MQQTTFTDTNPRTSTVNGLAIVGFVALVFIGMVLAIYAARYVPVALSRLAGAVYLSTDGKGDGNLQVVPNLPFPAATTTPATVATTTTPAPVATVPVHTTPSAGLPSTTAYPIKVPVTTTFYGLPNFTVAVTAVGYLDTNSKFVQSRTIASGQTLAVQYRVTNAGTNVTRPWNIHMTLPTQSNGTYGFDSNVQESLPPGAWVDFTLHLDARDVRVANNQEIDILVDSGHDVIESNENDNEAIATISVTN